eukprot:Selendium_serpulae@DN5738_c0_g1_i8.p1
MMISTMQNSYDVIGYRTCKTVCTVCIKCCDQLPKKKRPGVVVLMERFLENTEVRQCIKKGEFIHLAQEEDALRKDDCFIYADDQAQRVRVGSVYAVPIKDQKGIYNMSQDDHSESMSSSGGWSMEDDDDMAAPIAMGFRMGFLEPHSPNDEFSRSNLITVSGDPKPVTRSVRAASTASQESQGRKAINLLHPMSSSHTKQSPISSKQPSSQREEHTSPITVKRDTSKLSVRSHRKSILRENTNLFRSYSDLVKFDSILKQQTPISSYELNFLREKLEHDSNDKSWDRVCNNPKVTVYKICSDKSPVVLVKAYVTVSDSTKEIVTHLIRHLPTRATW